MAGFFRKMAGAFVEFPEAPKGEAPGDMTSDDVSALLEQLGTSGASAPKSSPQPQPSPPPQPPPVSDADALALAPEQVFERSGLADSPNSSLRLMKILQGLALFPAEQQLAMVRALDAADASWDESSVLADARARQSALRGHLEGVEREHGRRQADILEQSRAAQAAGDEATAEIDQQIAMLQAHRQEALTETAKAVSALDAQRREVDVARERARTAVAEMSSRLSDLIDFFAGKRPAQGPGPHGP